MWLNLIKLVSALFLAAYIRQLIQSFSFMSLSELRRRSESGSRQAAKVLAARVHGLKLWLILWLMFALMIFAIVTALDDLLRFWLATPISMVILISLLFISPRMKWPPSNLDRAAEISPILTKILDQTKIISKILRPLGLSGIIKTESLFHIHSKEHLVEMLEDLKSQTKSKRVLADLEMAILTLTFSSKKVGELMVPLEKIKNIRATQDLTPKLIDKLHNSGFSVFPVQRSEEGDFCGVLYLRDVEKLKRTKAVHQLMKKEVCYINTEAPLNQVLDAFLKTQQQLFLVVDKSSEILGLIDLKDVLQRYMGERQLTDFKYYDDLSLVAQQFVSEKDTVVTKKKPQTDHKKT